MRKGLRKNKPLFYSKNAQVTLFVIIGLILLITVSMILYAQRLSLNTKLETQARQVVNSFVEQNSLNQYVKGCLDLVASDGLLLLGEQGGVIFEYQGGLSPSTNFIEGRDYLPNTFFRRERGPNGTIIYEEVNRNTSYAVKARVSGCAQFVGPFIANDFTNDYFSYYPTKETYFKDFIRKFRKHYVNGGCYGYYQKPHIASSGFLGENDFPRLCSYNGSNKFDPFSRIQPCQPQEYDSQYDPTSFQRQLESYIKNNLGSCINLSLYEKYSGTPLHIDESKVNVSVIFEQPRGLIVKATYPLTIQVSQREISETTSFQTELDTNIRKLYRYISKLLIDYVRDPKYNLTRDWNDTSKNPYYQDTFEMFYYSPSCQNCQQQASAQDHLLTFVDHSSILKGRPWSITLAIKQRNPVLDYLHEEGLDSTFNGEKIDYQFFANSTATIDPIAIDPDGGNITYIFKGWKEDYDEYLNWTECSQNPQCNLTTLQQFIERIEDAPRKWSNSDDFRTSRRTASINTSFSDVGLHNVTVVVRDKDGRTDFQIIRVLVFDLPIARLNQSNGYDDINDEWASIEDPFTIDASASTASMIAGGTINAYVYSDQYSQGFFIITNESKINISNYYLNATQDFFKKNNYDSSTPEAQTNHYLDHEINLFVRQNDSGVVVQSTTASRTIHVAECLPHFYNQQNSGQAFNPLSDFSEEYDASKGFDTAHVCCEPIVHPTNFSDMGGGIIVDNNFICREKNFNMTRPDLSKPYDTLNKSIKDIQDSSTGEVWSVQFDFSTASPLTIFPSSLSQNTNLRSANTNDIFSASFKQRCSGLRGNTCGGDFSISWSSTPCNDFGNVDDQFARCQGPAREQGSYLAPLTNTEYHEALECKNFDEGHSYEKDILGIDSSSPTTAWSNKEKEHIAYGECAPPRQAKLDQNGNLIIDFSSSSAYSIHSNSQNPYICKATCDPTTGQCDYWNKENCEINIIGNQAGSVCNGLKPTNFDFSNNKLFFCKGIGIACDYEANTFVINHGGPESCYCRTTGSSPFSEQEATNNEYYFPGQVNDCCVAGVTIAPGNNANKVCYNGVVYNNSDIWGNNKLLSFNGNIYCCANQNNQCLGQGPSITIINQGDMAPQSQFQCTNLGWG